MVPVTAPDYILFSSNTCFPILKVIAIQPIRGPYSVSRQEVKVFKLPCVVFSYLPVLVTGSFDSGEVWACTVGNLASKVAD